MAKNLKYSVNLLRFNPNMSEEASECTTIFPFGYQDIVFKSLNNENNCVFCGEPYMLDVCTCPDYMQVVSWLKQRDASSKLVITKFDVMQISANDKYCRSRLVECKYNKSANPVNVKIANFDFCTWIEDKKCTGAIMLSRAWQQMNHVCFYVHREGIDGVYLVKVNLHGISRRYPVYHVEWRTNRATFEMDIERQISADIIVKKLSAVRLPE